MKKTCNIFILLCLVLIFSSKNIYSWPDENDLIYLPKFCQLRFYFGKIEDSSKKKIIKNRLKSKFGSDYIHLHHYCAALDYARKAQIQIINSKAQQSLLQSAVQEMDYMLKHTSKRFFMRPHIHQKKGQYLMMLGKNELGMRELKKAEVLQKKLRQ